MELRLNNAYSSAAAYYRLNDNTDIKGGFDMTSSTGSPTYTTGKYGSCIDLTSGNKAIYVNNNLGGTYNQDKTIRAYFKANDTPASGAWEIIASWGFATGDVYYYLAYENNSGTPRIIWARDRYGVGRSLVGYNITLNTSLWYDIVVTYSGGNGTIYVNGSSVAGPTAIGTATGNNGCPDRAVIGAVIDVNARYCDGYVDDVSFFNSALSAATIAKLNLEHAGGAVII